MITCPKCGNPIDDGKKFCPDCGASLPGEFNDANTSSADKTVLDTTVRFLRYERTSWIIGGIVLIFCTVLYILLGLLFFAVGLAARSDNELGLYSAIPLFYFSISVVWLSLIAYLPLAIVNFAAVKRINMYINTIYSDASIARKRCSSVGMIVFAAIFNQIALIFIIINFVRTKRNAKAFDRIEANQKH